MSDISVEREGRTAFLCFDRPPVNAVDLNFLREAEVAMSELEADDGVGAIIVTGKGPAFCAGLDLKVIPFYDREEQKELMELVNRVITGIYGASKPVIAAVNGHALAGGFMVVMSCDYRLGARGPIRLGITEVRVGIPFPFSTMEVLKAELTATMARRLILTGHGIDPEQALEGQVFDELCEPEALLDRAREVASDLGSLSTLVYNRIKTQIRGDTIRRIRRVMEEGDPMFEMWSRDRAVESAEGYLDRRET